METDKELEKELTDFVNEALAKEEELNPFINKALATVPIPASKPPKRSKRFIKSWHFVDDKPRRKQGEER